MSLEVEDPQAPPIILRYFRSPSREPGEVLREKYKVDPQCLNSECKEPVRPLDNEALTRLYGALQKITITLPKAGGIDVQRCTLDGFGFDLGFFDDGAISLRISPAQFDENGTYYGVKNVRIGLRLASCSTPLLTVGDNEHDEVIYFEGLEPQATYKVVIPDPAQS